MTKSLDEMRNEAAAIIAKMKPLKAELQQLQMAHAELAWQIEQESRRQTVVKHIARGVSGRTKPTKRPLNHSSIMEQFKNLPADVQAKLVAQLAAQ